MRKAIWFLGAVVVIVYLWLISRVFGVSAAIIIGTVAYLSFGTFEAGYIGAVTWLADVEQLEAKKESHFFMPFVKLGWSKMYTFFDGPIVIRMRSKPKKIADNTDPGKEKPDIEVAEFVPSPDGSGGDVNVPFRFTFAKPEIAIAHTLDQEEEERGSDYSPAERKNRFREIKEIFDLNENPEEPDPLRRQMTADLEVTIQYTVEGPLQYQRVNGSVPDPSVSKHYNLMKVPGLEAGVLAIRSAAFKMTPIVNSVVQKITGKYTPDLAIYKQPEFEKEILVELRKLEDEWAIKIRTVSINFNWPYSVNLAMAARISAGFKAQETRVTANAERYKLAQEGMGKAEALGAEIEQRTKQLAATAALAETPGGQFVLENEASVEKARNFQNLAALSLGGGGTDLLTGLVGAGETIRRRGGFGTTPTGSVNNQSQAAKPPKAPQAPQPSPNAPPAPQAPQQGGGKGGKRGQARPRSRQQRQGQQGGNPQPPAQP